MIELYTLRQAAKMLNMSLGTLRKRLWSQTNPGVNLHKHPGSGGLGLTPIAGLQASLDFAPGVIEPDMPDFTPFPESKSHRNRPKNAQSKKVEIVSRVESSTPEGIRTHDPRIRNPNRHITPNKPKRAQSETIEPIWAAVKGLGSAGKTQPKATPGRLTAQNTAQKREA